MFRGDYADLIGFDEWQLTPEDLWDEVGVPMLLDNNGDAVFIYTPPSLRSSGMNRARDPRHASKMFKKFEADESTYTDSDGNTHKRYATFHFQSTENPYLSREALADITKDMSKDSYMREIRAEDDDSQLNLLVYSAFNEQVCLIPRFEIPKDWSVYVGHDFGSAHPAALFAAVNLMGEIYLWHEYSPYEGKSTYENIKAFRDIVKLPVPIPTQQTYKVMNRLGGSHQEDGWRGEYALQSWPITEPHINKVMVQIDRVKQLMEKNRIFIFDDMHQTIEQLNSCLWDLDDMGQPTKGRIKDEKKYHLLACLRYLCTAFFPEREVQNQSPRVHVAIW